MQDVSFKKILYRLQHAIGETLS